MWSQRGSTTIMAIVAMIILMMGASSFAYVTNRNQNIATNFGNGLQAQYTAESAVRLLYITGQESLSAANGWTNQESSLAEWGGAALTAGTTMNITLPGMGTAKVTVTCPSTGKYNVQSVSTVNGVTRLAFNDNINVTTTATDTTVTTALLISQGTVSTPVKSDGTVLTGNDLTWVLPTDLTSTTSPAISPGYSSSSDTTWQNLYTQVLFNDSLGLSDFVASDTPQTLFRINYYIKLTHYVGSGDAAGYGVYYLAQKFYDPASGSWDTGNPNNPRAYVVQFDPGITDWGASSSESSAQNAVWPFGALLVKKVCPPNLASTAAGTNTGPTPSTGAGYECWDETNQGSYSYTEAFQDNNEFTQSPTLTLLTSGHHQPTETIPPTVLTAPTSFSTTLTGKYYAAPPDLRIDYTLGAIAEGNPWQASTTYPKNAVLTAGTWVSDWTTRLVYIASNSGTSGTTKPTFPTVAGQTVKDGSITWTAQLAPTSVAIAQKVIANPGLQVVKISMGDLKTRLDAVNGTTAQSASLYTMPFSMTTENKITIELVVDDLGNRVHLIRVNDVLALVFNDKYSTATGYYNILPQGWETSRSLSYPYVAGTTDLRVVAPTSQLGTGLRVWNAVAEFYTMDDYGQGTSIPGFGVWGR